MNSIIDHSSIVIIIQLFSIPVAMVIGGTVALCTAGYLRYFMLKTRFGYTKWGLKIPGNIWLFPVAMVAGSFRNDEEELEFGDL